MECSRFKPIGFLKSDHCESGRRQTGGSISKPPPKVYSCLIRKYNEPFDEAVQNRSEINCSAVSEEMFGLHFLGESPSFTLTGCWVKFPATLSSRQKTSTLNKRSPRGLNLE